jgi:hypothetical protein
MKNSSKDNADFQFIIERQQDQWGIQIKGSKKVYTDLFNGLMPVIYAGLLTAGVFFSSPNTGGKAPPALPVTCPRIEVPGVGQGKSA